MDAAPVDASVCPLCGGANRCAMEVERETGVKQPACWCVQAEFTAALLARVPVDARNRACICAACAAGDRQARTVRAPQPAK